MLKWMNDEKNGETTERMMRRWKDGEREGNDKVRASDKGPREERDAFDDRSRLRVVRAYGSFLYARAAGPITYQN